MKHDTKTEANSTLHSPAGRPGGGWIADDRGAVMNEYVVVTGFVGLVAIPAFALLGYVVAHSYSFMQGYLLFMFP